MTDQSHDHVEELLKSKHEYEFSRKKTLDGKSNNIISGSGTIASIYLGFGIVVLTNLFETNFEFNFSAIILFSGVLSLVISIIFAVLATLLRDYETPFNHEQFFCRKDENNNFTFNDKKILEYLGRDNKDMSKLMVKIYTKCIVLNQEKNDEKVKFLNIGQLIFLVGIATLPIFIISLVF